MLRLVVRAKSSALALAAIHQAVPQTLPAGAVVHAETLVHRADNELNPERMLVTLSGGFALLAPILAGLGLYGLAMRSVSLRTREVGIRMAMGASRMSVLLAIGRRIVVEVLLGIVAGGGLGSVFLDRAAENLLAVPVSLGANIYLLSSAVLLCVVAAAVYAPARRAASIDPMQALRSE